jgi:hypothetical protein
MRNAWRKASKARRKAEGETTRGDDEKRFAAMPESAPAGSNL